MTKNRWVHCYKPVSIPRAVTTHDTHKINLPPPAATTTQQHIAPLRTSHSFFGVLGIAILAYLFLSSFSPKRASLPFQFYFSPVRQPFSKFLSLPHTKTSAQTTLFPVLSLLLLCFCLCPPVFVTLFLLVFRPSRCQNRRIACVIADWVRKKTTPLSFLSPPSFSPSRPV